MSPRAAVRRTVPGCLPPGAARTSSSVTRPRVPLLDGPLWGFDLGDAHLTRFDGKTGRREAGSSNTAAPPRTGTSSLPMASRPALRFAPPWRSSTLGSVEAALVVANHFLHRADFTPEQLRNAVRQLDRALAVLPQERARDQARPIRGSSRWGRAGPSTSCGQRHFPTPESQYEVFDNGRLIARLDFAYPELGIWIEFDGKVKYQRLVTAMTTTRKSRGSCSARSAVRRESRRSPVGVVSG